MTDPAGAGQLPSGVPSRALLLRRERDVAVVYDPVSRDIMLVGDRVAGAVWTDLNR